MSFDGFATKRCLYTIGTTQRFKALVPRSFVETPKITHSYPRHGIDLLRSGGTYLLFETTTTSLCPLNRESIQWEYHEL